MDKNEIRRLLNDWERREYIARQTLFAEHRKQFKNELEAIIEKCSLEGGHTWRDIPFDLHNPNSVNFVQCRWCQYKRPRED